MFQRWRKWFRRRSLTFRLGASISLCIFIGAIAFWICIAEHTRPIIRSHIEELARHPLYEVASEIQSSVWDAENVATTMKNTLKELKSTDVGMMRNLLNSALQTLIQEENDVAHAWVYVFENENEDVTQGTMYSGVIKDGKFQFKNSEITDFYSLYPWFKEVPKEESEFWSDPYYARDFSGEILVTTCLIPFKFLGSEKYNGLVSVSLDVESLYSYLDEFETHTVGKFMVTTGKGDIVRHPIKELQGKNIFEIASEKSSPELTKIGEDFHNGITGSIELPASTVYDSASILFYTPIRDLKWGVGLVFSKRDFAEPVRYLQIKAILSLLFGMIVLLILVNIICHRSTKPLLELSKIAVQYGEGNFEAELPNIDSKDEIGTMNMAFRRMRDNLLKYIDLVRNAATAEQRAQSELEIAQQIQLSALPVNFPVHRAFEICAMMTAAKKVGGDFYDFFFVDEDHFAMVIADVSGKGIPAALYMMNAKALIRSTAKTGAPVSKVFFKVNNELCRGGANMFVTAFMAVLNIKTGELDFVNAGHNQPFYRNADGYRKVEVKRNMVLGGLENIKFEAETLQMASGDRLFLYTDGVNEAQNNNGEFYGDERLENILNQDLQSPFDALNQVKNDVAEFTQGAEQSDDLTMLEILFCQAPEGTFVTEAQVKNVDKVLGFVEQDVIKNKISKENQSKIMIITEEVFSNIAQYAYRKTGMARITTKLTDGIYYLRFTDNGPEYNPQKTAAPDLTKPIDERSIGGLGIFLVKKMADKLEYRRENGQNILTIGVKVKD